MTPAQEKARLRSDFGLARRHFSQSAECELATQKIQEFLRPLLSQVKVCGAYVPLASEVDLSNLYQLLPVKWAFPKVIDESLHFFHPSFSDKELLDTKQLKAKPADLDSKHHSSIDSLLGEQVQLGKQHEQSVSDSLLVRQVHRPALDSSSLNQFATNSSTLEHQAFSLSEEFFKFQPPLWEESSLGTMEPVLNVKGSKGDGVDDKNFQIITKQELSAILVPGIAFDKEGYRLGMGKGFYDKYLSNYKGLIIGVCFANQLAVTPLPKESHDQQLDYIVNEKFVLSPEREQGRK